MLWCDIKSIDEVGQSLVIVFLGSALSKDLVNDWYPDSTSNTNQVDDYY